MKRKIKIIVYTTCIIITLLMLLGFTYGYFITKIKGNDNKKSVHIVSGDSSILYTDLSTTEINDLIEPGYTITKLFTIKNTGNVDAKYSIYLTDVVNNFERKQDITYTLYRKVGNNTITESNLDSCEVIVKDKEYPSTKSVVKADEIISTSTLYYTYALKITYINHPTESQNVDQGKKFSGKVQIYASSSEDLTNPFSEGTLSYTILNNAITAKNNNDTTKTIYSETPKTNPGDDISLKFKKTSDPTVFNSTLTNVTNYYIVYSDEYSVIDSTGYYKIGSSSNPATVVKYSSSISASTLKGKYAFWSTNQSGVKDWANTNFTKLYKISDNESDITSTSIKYAELSTEQTDVERVLTKTDDDYGISYYFRGLPLDNYINFAGMCWRIVRIEGDGSIKLILENKDKTCKESNGEKSISLGTSYWGTDAETIDGKSTERDNYLNPSYNSASALVTVFKNFQTNTLKEQLGYLKSGDWCLDNKGYVPNVKDTKNEIDKDTYINNFSEFYYGPYIRLDNDTPSNKCEGTKLNKYNDNTEMYVATLTSDEMVFAGANMGMNYNYLRVNDLAWYSLSPGVQWCVTNSCDFYPLAMHSYGAVDMASNATSNARPVISLKYNIQINAGDGTIDNPYTIKTI